MNREEKLLELIERLEKAEGPDRELDRDIYEIAKRGRTERVSHEVIAADYTGSIDAALTLVPEMSAKTRPLSITFSVSHSGRFWQCVIKNWEWGELDSGNRCATPAITLCIAALKAQMKEPK